jgi:hypothetical protein
MRNSDIVKIFGVDYFFDNLEFAMVSKIEKALDVKYQRYDGLHVFTRFFDECKYLTLGEMTKELLKNNEKGDSLGETLGVEYVGTEFYCTNK